MARVMVIDDNQTIRETFSRALSKVGHEVNTACNGLEGLQLHAQCPVELIITDIVMPSMEGNELIIQLRKEYPEVKIIAISGSGFMSADEYLKVASLLGAHRTLKKPVDMDDLFNAVSELLALPAVL